MNNKFMDGIEQVMEGYFQVSNNEAYEKGVKPPKKVSVEYAEKVVQVFADWMMFRYVDDGGYTYKVKGIAGEVKQRTISELK